MVYPNAFSQFETLLKTFLCLNLNIIHTRAKSRRHQSCNDSSKYVHIALEGQPTIVVDDLFVVDHFILNTQTTRVASLFI
ncbi:hypothetical protein Hanom_Chr12g01126011 [Helianthus anomalus]